MEEDTASRCSALAALATDLEQATEGNGSLDWRIADALRRSWELPVNDPPPFTTSLDAALSLVPEGWTWVVSWQGGKPWAAVGEGEGEPWIDWSPDSAATPSLALCIAALKARAVAAKPRAEGAEEV